MIILSPLLTLERLSSVHFAWAVSVFPLSYPSPRFALLSEAGGELKGQIHDLEGKSVQTPTGRTSRVSPIPLPKEQFSDIRQDNVVRKRFDDAGASLRVLFVPRPAMFLNCMTKCLFLQTIFVFTHLFIPLRKHILIIEPDTWQNASATTIRWGREQEQSGRSPIELFYTYPKQILE